MVMTRTEIKHELVMRKGGQCADCGGQFPDCCLDFDHTDPLTKGFNIGHHLGRKPFEELCAEADHCDLVCANCHRIRTSGSAAVRAKMQRSHVGRKRRQCSKATRLKIAASRIGKSIPPEVRSKISASLAGNQNRRARTDDGRFA